MASGPGIRVRFAHAAAHGTATFRRVLSKRPSGAQHPETPGGKKAAAAPGAPQVAQSFTTPVGAAGASQKAAPQSAGTKFDFKTYCSKCGRPSSLGFGCAVATAKLRGYGQVTWLRPSYVATIRTARAPAAPTASAAAHRLRPWQESAGPSSSSVGASSGDAVRRPPPSTPRNPPHTGRVKAGPAAWSCGPTHAY